MTSQPAKVLGIRVESENVFWAVMEGTVKAPVVVAEGKIPAPVSEDDAGKLVAQRNAVLDVIREHVPTTVFVRFAETWGPAQKGEAPRKRYRIEGVIMEAAASRSIPVRTGPLTTIGKGLGLDVSQAKVIRDRGPGVGSLQWGKRPIEAREAIMAATAALT